jgi:hypothetical protein
MDPPIAQAEELALEGDPLLLEQRLEDPHELASAPVARGVVEKIAVAGQLVG